MGQEKDITLIEKAKNGDDDAFTTLFQNNYSFLYKYLLKLTLDEETSNDLAQETMVKCYQHLSSFKEKGKFSTWMISIGSRLYIDQIRKKEREKKKMTRLMHTLSRQLSFRAKSNGMEWSDTFSDFNQLDAQTRTPILLRHYYGYSYEEIGDILGVKAGTVKSRVHNGIKQFRKEWDDEKQ
ncbi:RNA polymerase sigma factor SigY [Sutcliffiella rhizosphaerae]|uniref:RNA polymerase sigma factor SigY n=1 Tax=Sutcliffiella rhizosphaerae TaxID=2880967 RepID=A0ABN8A8D0_9BACI|nr:RNA polymerase sigma factor SigY [Sutcliffiella rhizosphaerae]CAG9621373.1 RNA polymerase sigma factor SigY [Sutcliffiella rhizosphaerae]